MKCEPRGKYSGVKVHLDEEECKTLLAAAEGIAIDELYHTPTLVTACLAMLGDSGTLKTLQDVIEHVRMLGEHIRKLLKQEPGLLNERTPEQIAAILAKESEKAALQLKALQSGAEWKKVDPDALNAAMSKLVNKQ